MADHAKAKRLKTEEDNLTYLIPAFFFIALFAYIAWRVFAKAPSNRSPQDTYICPHCNEQHCDCHKEEP